MMRWKLGLVCGNVYSPVGRNPLADEIRERAYATGWHMKELSRACGTTGNFLADSNLRMNGLNMRAASMAIDLLGGEVYAVWED